MLISTQIKNEKRLDNAGFTLLEIIAVIVILSIIAVVAVPRYFDLQEEARNKTIKTGLAEAIGRVNGRFAEALLAGSMPWEIDLRAEVLGSDMGDFTLYTSPSAEGNPDRNAVATNFRIWVMGTGPLRGMSAGTQLPRPGL